MLLELQDLKRSFGAMRVIDGIDLSVAAGEVLGILGPNGAGKSTLFNLISGNLRPTGGEVIFEGKRVTRDKSWTRIRMGIGRTFQIPKPFVHMTVFENALVAATHGTGLSLGRARHVAAEALELTQLSSKQHVPAGNLSLLDLKRLEMSKALATQPRLLLLDEIAGGLTDAECETLLRIIEQVHARNVTIVWIEHVVHALMRVATRLVVLAEGGLVASGAPREVLADRQVQELYLGALE